jgi:hypothetical protein
MTYFITLYKRISEIVWILNPFDRYHLQSSQVLLKEKYKKLATKGTELLDVCHYACLIRKTIYFCQ